MREWVPAGIDVCAVLAFVAIGRVSHDEALSPIGFAGTAWPFLVGLAVGWAAVRAGRRRPEALVPAGAAIWAATLVIGMVLRAVTGQGTAVAFVVVASLFLAAVLLGWRLVAGFRRAER